MSTILTLIPLVRHFVAIISTKENLAKRTGRRTTIGLRSKPTNTMILCSIISPGSAQSIRTEPQSESMLR